MKQAYLQTALGGSRLLGQPGGRRLHLLNASAAELWDCWHSQPPATGAAGLERHLRERHGLPPALARAQVDRLLDDWRALGLLSPPTGATEGAAWVSPPPPARLASAGDRLLTLAGLRLGLAVESEELGRPTLALCAPMATPGETSYQHHLRLSGTADAWRLELNGTHIASGASCDEAALVLYHLAVDLACQAEDRLLVLHGAGLKLDDDRGLLLIGPGGSGKTTLAAALNAGGRSLLSDDVVPVRRDGALLGLNTPICLKPGSWPVLEPRRTELATIATLMRFGQSVRYLPPLGRPVTEALRPGLLLFPRYRSGQPATVTALTPEAALQGIVEAEAVIRQLDQSKLEDLARWVDALPAYALIYPDMETALVQVDTLLQRHSA